MKVVASYRHISRLFHRLHSDQSGDIPVGPILIIGLVIIPLVLVLAIFKADLWTWFIGVYADMRGSNDKIKY